MTNKAINIDHSDSSINVGDAGYIILSKNGAVRIGNGTTVPETNLADYEGLLRFNETSKKIEYCDGESWNELLINDDVDYSLIYSFLF